MFEKRMFESWKEFEKELEEIYGRLAGLEKLVEVGKFLDILEHVEEYLSERNPIKMTETSWTIDNADDLKQLFAVIYLMYLREPFDIIDVQIFWDLEKEVEE